MGVNGVDTQKGLTIRHYEESLVKQKMMQSAKKTICCVIEEKIGIQEGYKVCDFKEINALITNIKPTDAKLANFHKFGVEIL
jgi:DeoR/GlpR family transcriptional regulator of sugar metabolism